MMEAPQQTWAERCRSTVVALLDRVIANTAQNHFNKISEGLPNPTIADNHEKALKEQDKLSAGMEKPIYDDDWFALHYLLYYQPKQINLAYHAIKWMPTDKQIGINARLNIFDFACGSLATQFGLAIAMADIIDCGGDIDHVLIENVDSAPAMVKLGETMWKAFKEEALELGHPLNEAVEKIEHIPYSGVEADNRLIPLTDTSYTPYFTMLHGIYDDGLDLVKERVNAWFLQLNPNIGIITSQDFKKDQLNKLSSNLTEVSHLQTANRASREQNNYPSEFWCGKLDKITGFRRRIDNNFRDYFVNEKYLHYMRKAVNINPIRSNSSPYIKYVCLEVS